MVTCLKLIHVPPSTPSNALAAASREFNCIILGSLTWQNLPFKEIRSRVLRREVSFQGRNVTKGEISLVVLLFELVVRASTSCFALIFYQI